MKGGLRMLVAAGAVGLFAMAILAGSASGEKPRQCSGSHRLLSSDGTASVYLVAPATKGAREDVFGCAQGGSRSVYLGTLDDEFAVAMHGTLLAIARTRGVSVLQLFTGRVLASARAVGARVENLVVTENAAAAWLERSAQGGLPFFVESLQRGKRVRLGEIAQVTDDTEGPVADGPLVFWRSPTGPKLVALIGNGNHHPLPESVSVPGSDGA